MVQALKLSELIGEIDATIADNFDGRTFWIKAEITDVKKQSDKRWCFLKFIEKDKNAITTEIKGVFWTNAYYNIENFEKATNQTFISGIEITCNVRVRFHKRFGLDLEVLEIDYAFTIGKLELERKKTIQQLVTEKIASPQPNGNFSTLNNRLVLPDVIQRIALITAPNSDGQRDFKNIIADNNYGFAFLVTEYLTQIQGDNASSQIVSKLNEVEKKTNYFDVVIIVRGGGSDTDFKSFNDFELAKTVANFPIPILTGIGHDRNTSIVDLMARQFKTPTEVAKFLLENNFLFDNRIEEIKDRILERIEELLSENKRKLEQYTIRVKSANPDTILKKGFAIIKKQGEVITASDKISVGDHIETFFYKGSLISKVTKINENE